MDLYLVCALILWRSGLGLLMGTFCQTLTELSAQDTPIFSFSDDNFRKCQGILTKKGKRKVQGVPQSQTAAPPRPQEEEENKPSTCIDMKEFWLGIPYGQISLIFDRVICLRNNNGDYYYFFIFMVQFFRTFQLDITDADVL